MQEGYQVIVPPSSSDRKFSQIKSTSGRWDVSSTSRNPAKSVSSDLEVYNSLLQYASSGKKPIMPLDLGEYRDEKFQCWVGVSINKMLDFDSSIRPLAVEPCAVSKLRLLINKQLELSLRVGPGSVE